jgi:hypothetical protein
MKRLNFLFYKDMEGKALAFIYRKRAWRFRGDTENGEFVPIWREPCAYTRDRE